SARSIAKQALLSPSRTRASVRSHSSTAISSSLPAGGTGSPFSARTDSQARSVPANAASASSAEPPVATQPGREKQWTWTAPSVRVEAALRRCSYDRRFQQRQRAGGCVEPRPNPDGQRPALGNVTEGKAVGDGHTEPSETLEDDLLRGGHPRRIPVGAFGDRP